MRDYCESCNKYSVCKYAEEFIKCIDDINATFAEIFPVGTKEHDMLSFRFICGEHGVRSGSGVLVRHE